MIQEQNAGRPEPSAAEPVPPAIVLTDLPPDRASMEQLESLLYNYNTIKAGVLNYRPLYLLVRDANGVVIAGLQGATYWDYLYIELLAIAQDERGKGLGSRLLKEAEAEAIKRGCHNAYLDTFSFQARPFYEKHGYTVFGILPQFPPGHERYFMEKRLSVVSGQWSVKR